MNNKTLLYILMFFVVASKSPDATKQMDAEKEGAEAQRVKDTLAIIEASTTDEFLINEAKEIIRFLNYILKKDK
jgi:hypothetical protein